jgi:hypothetical protein
MASLQVMGSIISPRTESISNFHRIEVHNGLVYVFVPDVDLESKMAKLKQIDIFSPEGEYLYRAYIKFEKNRHPLFSPLNNLIIQNRHLYAVLMDEKDNVRVAKYEIALPIGASRAARWNEEALVLLVHGTHPEMKPAALTVFEVLIYSPF